MTSPSIRGKLLSSKHLVDDKLIDKVDADGKHVSSFRFDELDSSTGTNGMTIPPNTVRIAVPEGLSRRPKDQTKIKTEICMLFHQAWPQAELPVIIFPISSTNMAVNRQIDIMIKGDVPRPIEVGLRLTTDWSILGKSFSPPYLLGACLPFNIIAVELSGVQEAHIPDLVRDAQDIFTYQFDGRSSTWSVVLDIWLVEREFVPNMFQYDSRIILVVDVRDANGKEASAAESAHYWPGFIKEYGGSGSYATSFVNRFSYCNQCNRKADALDDRHTAEDCPKTKCTVCKQYGHYRSSCPLATSLPARPAATALTSAQRAFPQGLPARPLTVVPASIVADAQRQREDNVNPSEVTAQEVQLDEQPPSDEEARTPTGNALQLDLDSTVRAERAISSGTASTTASQVQPTSSRRSSSPRNETSSTNAGSKKTGSLRTMPARPLVKLLPSRPSFFLQHSLPHSLPSFSLSLFLGAASIPASIMSAATYHDANLSPLPVASWNVNGLSPEVWQCIRDVSSRHGVQVWLLQEWRQLTARARVEAAPTTPLGWPCTSGRATAILLADNNLHFVSTDNNDHSSRATIGSASGQTWEVVSLYLPVTPSDRRALLRDVESCQGRLLLHDLASSQKVVVGGDMNIQNDARQVDPEWSSLCEVLDPLQDAMSTLHPFSDVGTRKTHGANAHWRRIDHIFTSSMLLDSAYDAKVLHSGNASDHIIIALLPKEAEEIQAAPSNRPLLRIDSKLVRNEDFIKQYNAFVTDRLSARQPFTDFSWTDWLETVGHITGWLFNYVALTKQKPCLAADLPVLISALNDIELTSAENLDRFSNLAEAIQIKRATLLRSEHLSLLGHQYDFSYWQKWKRQQSDPALEEEAVLAFFADLYSAPATDRRRPSFSSALTGKGRRWIDPEHLEREFTAEEAAEALRGQNEKSATGVNGIPMSLLRKSPPILFEALAAALNHLSSTSMSARSGAKVSLLFKRKPGNDPKDPVAYRPISLMDSNKRWVRTILANRIAPQLSKMLPATQTGFVKYRSGFSNGLVLELLQASLRYGWIDHTVVFLDQDQAKAFDKVSHKWRDLVLSDLGTPPRTFRLIQNLADGFQLRFSLASGVSAALIPQRGLPQGAAESPGIYLLLQEPLFDALNSSRTGTKVIFCGRQHRLHFMAYADNCFFVLGSEEATRAYLSARDKYDVASGSTLNVTESKASILKPASQNNSPPPTWASAFASRFAPRPSDSTFKLLGRVYVLDPAQGPPLQELLLKIAEALGHGWNHMKPQTGIFTRAQIVNQFLLSRIWHILDVGYLSSWHAKEEIEKTVRARVQPFLHSTHCKAVAWNLTVTPKRLGGLGVLPPIIQSDAKFTVSWSRIVLDATPHGLGVMFRDAFQHWLWTYKGIRMSTLLFTQSQTSGKSRKSVLSKHISSVHKGRAKLGLAASSDPPTIHEDFFHRLLELNFQLHLNWQFNFDSLSPQEVLMLPWSDASLYCKNIAKTGRTWTVVGADDSAQNRPFSDDFSHSISLCAAMVSRAGIYSLSDLLWHCDLSSHTSNRQRLPPHVGPPLGRIAKPRTHSRHVPQS